MAVSRYVTLSKITHCGVDFPPSTPVALSDAYAAPLLAAGAIAAQAGALPSMPAVPGNVVRETVDTAAGGKAKSYLEVTSGLDGRIRFSVNGSQEFPAVGEIGSITYDSAGRVSTYIDQGATWALTYDSAGRVSTRSNGVSTQTAQYDSAGRFTGWA